MAIERRANAREGVTPAPCPSCGAKVDAATIAAGPDVGPAPSPGDWSVCFYCGELAVFTDEGGLRPATEAELAAALTDPAVAEAIGAIKTYRETTT